MPRILVVEDDPQFQAMIQTMLAPSGYTVVGANNGRHALRLLQTDTEFNALLTDIMMPEVNGAALTAVVRQRFPRLPILIISAYPQWADEALENGANDYLPKPFQLHELLNAVAQVIAPSGG